MFFSGVPHRPASGMIPRETDGRFSMLIGLSSVGRDVGRPLNGVGPSGEPVKKLLRRGDFPVPLLLLRRVVKVSRASRPFLRPPDKARFGCIPGVCGPIATQSAGMQGRSNAVTTFATGCQGGSILDPELHAAESCPVATHVCVFRERDLQRVLSGPQGRSAQCIGDRVLALAIMRTLH